MVVAVFVTENLLLFDKNPLTDHVSLNVYQLPAASKLHKGHQRFFYFHA